MKFGYFLQVFVIIQHYAYCIAVVYLCDRNAICGCSNSDANLGRIIGGENAIQSSWGWMVSLQRILGESFCGGTIVSPSMIITAAHCVAQYPQINPSLYVVAGIDKPSESNSLRAQVRSVSRIFIHQDYVRQMFLNDIAVLQLDEPLLISYGMRTSQICLPTAELNISAILGSLENSSFVAIGWGTINSTLQFVSPTLHLQQVTLDGIASTHPMCSQVITNNRTQFCAGILGGGKDTCQGDSGGPLMYFDPTTRRWILVGITSFGIQCATEDYAGVYTRVSSYNDWFRYINSSEVSTGLGTNKASYRFELFFIIVFYQWLLIMILQ